VELTDAGRVFVEQALLALFHTERAVHLARDAHEGSDSILTVGHLPYADHAWIPAMLAIRLPLYPRLRIRLMTQFAMESLRGVLVGELSLALVTAPPQDVQIRLGESANGHAEQQAISDAIRTLRTIQREKLGYPQLEQK
jgi:DNA-binding transcriptional LysR family regulator